MVSVTSSPSAAGAILKPFGTAKQREDFPSLSGPGSLLLVLPAVQLADPPNQNSKGSCVPRKVRPQNKGGEKGRRVSAAAASHQTQQGCCLSTERGWSRVTIGARRTMFWPLRLGCLRQALLFHFQGGKIPRLDTPIFKCECPSSPTPPPNPNIKYKN